LQKTRKTYWWQKQHAQTEV
ncbi:peptidase M20/M25/M40 family protein, partial [Vibrio parahaemolyticus V-223/04]